MPSRHTRRCHFFVLNSSGYGRVSSLVKAYSAIMFYIAFISERVVVHASGTGSRGPRVGRRSHLAGPGSDDGGRAGGVAGPGSRGPRGARGRRGPGQPGSARLFPGESSSRAAGFGPGMALDVLPGCAQLAVAADAAAGDDDGFDGVSEAELVGLVCAWDRVEAHAAARKLAAIAEVARRNPGPEGAEVTGDQVACALGESRARTGELIGTAGGLDTDLPGTKAALRDG